MTGLASSPVSVFLATARADEAKAFYESVLGLPLKDDNPYALVFDLHGVELRISKVPGFTPFPWTVLDWQVEDIAASMKLLTANGIEFVCFDGIDHDADGVWTTPDGQAKIAWFKDPDENVLSVSERS
ncbi:MAG: VOC family protein [Aquisalinus sp.]|nr:VOC family protein [Aquisalinus sp.]